MPFIGIKGRVQTRTIEKRGRETYSFNWDNCWKDYILIINE
jgi:hypothetical protein